VKAYFKSLWFWRTFVLVQIGRLQRHNTCRPTLNALRPSKLQRMLSERLQAVSCMDGKLTVNFLCLISQHPQHNKPLFLVLTTLNWWNALALHFLRWIYADSRKDHLIHGVLIAYILSKEASEHWNYIVRRKSGIWNSIKNLEYITKL